MINNASTVTLTVDNMAVVDTMFDPSPSVARGRKFFVSSFQGHGTLEASDDETNWIDTTSVENQLIPMERSLPRYIRINGNAGDKQIHLVSL